MGEVLADHFGRRPILLRPLLIAAEQGFGAEMKRIFNSMLTEALGLGSIYDRAFITSTLDLSADGVLSGVRELKTFGIFDDGISELMGFTRDEAAQVLAACGLSSHLPDIIQAYSDRRIGSAERSSPWDVLGFCRLAQALGQIELMGFWADAADKKEMRFVHDFVDRIESAGDADGVLVEMLRSLAAGESAAVKLPKRFELPVDGESPPLDQALLRLLMTGWLAIDKTGRLPDDRALLRIPNEEVREVFVDALECPLRRGNPD